MNKEIISTSHAPKPIGPYSQGVIAGGFLFVSGQIPLDPETGKIVSGSFEDKARRAIENLLSIVRKAGGKAEDIVRVTVYLKDIEKYGSFNKVYSSYFKEKPPSRVVVAVRDIPGNADLELDAIAYIGRGEDGC